MVSKPIFQKIILFGKSMVSNVKLLFLFLQKHAGSSLEPNIRFARFDYTELQKIHIILIHVGFFVNNQKFDSLLCTDPEKYMFITYLRVFVNTHHTLLCTAPRKKTYFILHTVFLL